MKCYGLFAHEVREFRDFVECLESIADNDGVLCGPIMVSRASNGAIVSTAFLGINHSFVGGEPLLFETMVSGGPCNDTRARCGTYVAALVQHDEALRENSNGEQHEKADDRSV